MGAPFPEPPSRLYLCNVKLLTKNFYKFLFGFAGILLLSLIIISIAGSIAEDSQNIDPKINTAGE